LAELGPGFERIQTLFVIGDYHRRFGDLAEMERYFSAAETLEWVDEEGKERIGADYINAMIAERRDLVAGKSVD